MKRSGIWYVCILAALPIVLAGPTCTCPIKALLAPDKVKKPAPASKPAATHTSSNSAPRAAETPAPGESRYQVVVAPARHAHILARISHWNFLFFSARRPYHLKQEKLAHF